MDRPVRILIIEDSPLDAELLLRALRGATFEYESDRVDSEQSLRQALHGDAWDIILSDHSMPGFSSEAALAVLQEEQLDIPFVIVSGRIGEETVVAAMRAGCRDFIPKDKLSRLVPVIERELREAQARREHAHARRTLRDREEQVALLLESTAEGIIGLDADGRGTFANPAAVRMLGFADEAALLGQPIVPLLRGDPTGDAVDVTEALRGGQRLHEPQGLIGKVDGTTLPAEYWLYPVAREDRPTKAILTFIDISDRHRLEAQLLQAQKMEAVGQLAGGVAHDFNNLLTAIFGYTEYARDAMPPGHAARDALSRVEDAAEQAVGVTRSLLAISGRTAAEPRVQSIQPIVHKTVRLLQRLLPAGVQLHTECPEEPPLYVLADGTQVQQVLMNLVINARDALPRGGEITLHVERVTLEMVPPTATGQWLRLRVRDNGEGMSPAVRNRVFDPFFTTKPAGQGTGLGLSIVHRIVTTHGGRIDVDSTPGHGTSVDVYLPEAAHEEAPPRRTGDKSRARGQRELVLLAEDTRQVRELLASVLEAHNYRVRDVDTGPALIELFDQVADEAALIITDLDLPGCDGLSCLQRIRQTRPHTPAIIITGSVGAQAEAMTDARTVLLRKPFDMPRFTGVVSELLTSDASKEA